MDLIETARALLKRIDALLENPEAKRASALPDGGYFLDENTVLCLERANGDARFPYTADGFNLWAHSSGYISINESTFYVVLSADGGKEPYLNFYAGLPADGGYVPVSLTGAARSPLEGETARYTVFTPQAVYYLTRTAAADFVVRAYVTREKTVRFSLAALGKTDTELYLAGYFNCFLMHAAAECCETPWFRQCRAIPSGFEFYSVEDLDRSTHLDNYGVLTRTVNAQETGRSTTTSRTDFTGAKSNYLAASRSLRTGRFAEGRQATKFTDTAIAGDIVRVALTDGGAAAWTTASTRCSTRRRAPRKRRRCPPRRSLTNTSKKPNGWIGRKKILLSCWRCALKTASSPLSPRPRWKNLSVSSSVR